MILQVGIDLIIDPKSKKERLLSYADLEGEGKEWIDASKFLPKDFELVLLKTDKGKERPGWLSGRTWDGYRISQDDNVLFWKRKQGFH